MESGRTTIRLVYPQWQGGIVSHWMPELAPDDASRGYWLGAQLLNMLAPAGSAKTVQVPVSLDISERKIENGIMDYAIIVAQTKAALATLEVENPDAVVTLGGRVFRQCSPVRVSGGEISGRCGARLARRPSGHLSAV